MKKNSLKNIFYHRQTKGEKDNNYIKTLYSDLKTRSFGFGRDVSLDQAVKYFSEIDPYHYLFFMNEIDNTFIGRAVLRIESETTASFGIAVDSKFHGRGYGFSIAEYILQIAFQHPTITNVYGTALRFNIPSQKLMQKLGMNPNGIQEKNWNIKVMIHIH